MGTPLTPAHTVRFATPVRYILPVLFLFITLHYIRQVTHEDGYPRVGALSSISPWHPLAGASNASLSNANSSAASDSLYGGHALSPAPPPPEAPRRANAAIVMLARNNELNAVAASMKQFEDRFNHRFGYPWVLLNDEPFSEDFMQRTSILTSANVSYGVIPHTHWNQPGWIDEDKARAGRERLMSQNIIYGDSPDKTPIPSKFHRPSPSPPRWSLFLPAARIDNLHHAGSVSYRNMCRFNSGFFYRHELLKPYRYYWRVEPGVSFFCDIEYDPFLMMQDENKVYGFTISLYEWEPTIPTLWPTVKKFMLDQPEHVAPDNAMRFLSDNGGDGYNLCHFWSNFEIADMDFWRGAAYSAFFDYLDSTGGFYYERWGDAPVHSIAAALLANRTQVHFFGDIGYRHPPFQRCPQGAMHAKGKCWCDPSDSFDYAQNSCLRRWEEATKS